MEKKSFKDIEKELSSHLSSAGLSKEHLSSVSKSIAESYANGLTIVDWWIYGVPAFERIVLQAQAPINKFDAFQQLITNERFKEILILRKGIPRPDFFQLQLTIEKISEKIPI